MKLSIIVIVLRCSSVPDKLNILPALFELTLQTTHVVGTIILIPFYDRGTCGLEKISGFLTFLSASKWWSQDSSPGLIDFKAHTLSISFFKPQPTVEKESKDKQNEKKITPTPTLQEVTSLCTLVNFYPTVFLCWRGDSCSWHMTLGVL